VNNAKETVTYIVMQREEIERIIAEYRELANASFDDEKIYQWDAMFPEGDDNDSISDYLTK
jgi:hypothetical protein